MNRILLATTMLAGLLATPAAAQQLSPQQVQTIRQQLNQNGTTQILNGVINEAVIRGNQTNIVDFSNYGPRLMEGIVLWGSDMEATELPPTQPNPAPAAPAPPAPAKPPAGPTSQTDFVNDLRDAVTSLQAMSDQNGGLSFVGGSAAGFGASDTTLDALRQQLAQLPTADQLRGDPAFADTVVTDPTDGGSYTVATLLPIYAGYQQALTATTWSSLDLYPPGPSSVATVPEVPWYSLSSAGTSPPFDWVSLSAAGNGLPLDAAAYDAAQPQRVAGSSAALKGALAWLMTQSAILTAAWDEPGNALIDPVARQRAYAALWTAFANQALVRAGLATDAALASRLFDLAATSKGDLLRATLQLGELLADSRAVVSTGGLSDVGISGLTLAYLLRDFGAEDGDRVNIRLTQFGRTLFSGQLSLLNAGTAYTQALRRGVAELTITALNEGLFPPNTAELSVQNVVRGDALQQYSLRTGESATLRIESNARPGGR